MSLFSSALRAHLTTFGLLAGTFACAGTALATEDPSDVLNGVYVGHRVGEADNKITIELRGPSFIMLHKDGVSVARIDEWTLAGPGTKTGGLRFKAVSTALSRTGRDGKPAAVLAGGKSFVRLHLDPTTNEAALCATAPGSKVAPPQKVPSRGATTNPEPGVACMELTRVWRPGFESVKAPDAACVAACVTRNQMRAVGIEVIEEDCGRECTR